MRVCAFLSILFLSMILLAIYSTAPTQASLSWSAQTVDENGSYVGNGYCPIKTDQNNTTHIAYTDWSEGIVRQFPKYLVMYASWTGKSWRTQQVSEGFAYSLVLDANGNPHILYGSPGGPLRYASWTGKTWVTETLDVNVAGFGMVALDSSGNPHVVYTNGERIKYAQWTGLRWNFQTVATYRPGDLAFRLSFALDKNDTPYIMYSASSYADYSQPVGIRAINVTLATYQNSSWNIQLLYLPPPTGDYGNMVVDSKGILHAIFTQFYVSAENKIRSTILYASQNGTAWSTQPVVSNVSSHVTMSLALDMHDCPHIFVSDGTYVTWTGNTWDIQTANLNRSAYGPCYLALDSSGNPNISYYQQIGSQVIANIVYATATETAQIHSPTLSPVTYQNFIILMVAVMVTIVAVAVVVYVWKKKK